MSNMLSLSRDSLLSDECVYANRTDRVASVCVCAPPPRPQQDPSFLIRTYLSGLASLSVYREGILSGQLPRKTAAFCPPTGKHGTVLYEIIHLIIGGGSRKRSEQTDMQLSTEPKLQQLHAGPETRADKFLPSEERLAANERWGRIASPGAPLEPHS